MSVIIIEEPPKDMNLEDAIRSDLAWQLFLKTSTGSIPKIEEGDIGQFRHWLWSELSKKLGFLGKSRDVTVSVIAPRLSDEGREFLIRTCSLWTNSVYLISCGGKNVDLGNPGENLWTPPIVNVKNIGNAGPALVKLTSTNSYNGTDTHYSPLLGAGKSYVRAYTIKSGGTYARFHSHTAREELYLILSGGGSVRIADHKVPVAEGDLVAKPLGPDISTQFLADEGQDMRVLDIEIWPEDEMTSKDLVSYPDHEELDLFGQGWSFTIPSHTVQSYDDAMSHYGTGYRRLRDGSWEPKDIPGFKKREKE